MITFYYTIPTLIDRVNIGVLYKVRNRGDILGLGSNSIIDAEILVKEYLQSSSSDIFSKLISPLSRTIADLEETYEPFEFNVTFTHPDTLVEYDECIVFRVILPDKFDTTTKPAIEKSIEDTMVSYCIWNWLMDSNIQGWEKYETEYIRKWEDLRSILVRRVNLKRTYKLY